MAEYRQVHCSFWQDSLVVNMTPEEKYFFLYLMTNPKTTQCGAYELPLRVMAFETGYNEETIRKLIDRFEDTVRIRYDYHTQEVFLVNWLRYNWINSPKVIPAVQKSAESIKSNRIRKEFNDVCIRYGYRMDRLAVEREREGEGEGEVQNPMVETDVSPACPQLEIVNLYNHHLPSGTQVRPKLWNGARAKALQARWREDADRQNPEWWGKFFGYCAKSKFLTGQTATPGRDPFVVSLDWILKPSNFTKIIEGFYHREIQQ